MRWVVFFMMLLCVGSVFWGVTGGTETAFGRVQVENTATQNQNPPPPLEVEINRNILQPGSVSGGQSQTITTGQESVRINGALAQNFNKVTINGKHNVLTNTNTRLVLFYDDDTRVKNGESIPPSNAVHLNALPSNFNPRNIKSIITSDGVTTVKMKDESIFEISDNGRTVDQKKDGSTLFRSTTINSVVQRENTLFYGSQSFRVSDDFRLSENNAGNMQNALDSGFFQSGSTITLKDDGTFKDANGGIYSFKRNDNIVTTEFQPPGGLTWTVTRTGDKNTYTINQNGQTISFTQGSNRITVDGQTYAKKLFGGWNCVSCSDDSTQLDDKVLDNIFTGTIEPLREHQTKEMKETNPRWSDFFRNENQFGESAGLGKTFNQVAGFMEMLGKMRSTLDAYTAYDRLFLGDSLNSWQMNVQDIFGGLTSAGWARRICESKFSMPPNQVAVAELPPGGVAITATVAGECGPIVEDYFGGSQRLYRLLVYVNNPRVQNQQVGQEQQDIRFTASITSDGESIPLFEEMQRVPPGETFTLSGENAIVFYSNASISEICIRLENPPPFFAGSDRFCNRITCD